MRMWIGLFGLVACLAFTGCGKKEMETTAETPSQAAMTKKAEKPLEVKAESIVGTWQVSFGGEGNRRQEVFTFNEDGTFSEVIKKEGAVETTLTGNWSLEGEMLKFEATSLIDDQGREKLEEPKTRSRRVTKLSTGTLAYEYGGGQRVYSRN